MIGQPCHTWKDVLPMFVSVALGEQEGKSELRGDLEEITGPRCSLADETTVFLRE